MEISYPDEVTIAGVQEFAAPKELVFEVFTQPEHLKQTLTPFDEKIVALEFDVRPGGMYDYTFVTPDGKPYRFFWSIFRSPKV
ncbi:SRPBCC domain-containing protein [Lactococcus fujiensis]|uniref:SRPBCC domain-containing protein n=1 Tax=Lactococcus fujiensis TaxID=610251 RepID=UPI0006D12FB7|nr:SRPBCC domain-containing protein [Lactococcus fujiensis]